MPRGRPFNIEPKLETSGQRLVSYTLLGAGAAAIVTGGVLGVLALGQETRPPLYLLGKLGGTDVRIIRKGESIEVKLGATDGRLTEILAGTLQEGMQVLVDAKEPS